MENLRNAERGISPILILMDLVMKKDNGIQQISTAIRGFSSAKAQVTNIFLLKLCHQMRAKQSSVSYAGRLLQR